MEQNLKIGLRLGFKLDMWLGVDSAGAGHGLGMGWTGSAYGAGHGLGMGTGHVTRNSVLYRAGTGHGPKTEHGAKTGHVSGHRAGPKYG